MPGDATTVPRRRRLPGFWRAAAALTVLAGMVVATGDGAAQDDPLFENLGDPRADRYNDGDPSGGGIRWRCSTPMCFWRDGYGEIKAFDPDTDELGEGVLNQGNASGWYRAEHDEVVACVSEDRNAAAEIVGVCVSRMPSRYDLGDEGNNGLEGFDSLWEYAGDEILIQTFRQVRHHNPFRCRARTCTWPQYDSNSNPVAYRIARSWPVGNGRWAFFYGTPPDYWGGDPGIAVAPGENENVQVHPSWDQVVVSYCLIVMPDPSHCSISTAGGRWIGFPGGHVSRGGSYMGDSHPTHRLDHPITKPVTFRCFRRSALKYPDRPAPGETPAQRRARQAAGHYRESVFGDWPAWTVWDHPDFYGGNRSYQEFFRYNSIGLEIGSDGWPIGPRCTDPSGGGGGGGGGGGDLSGGGDPDDNTLVRMIHWCRYQHPDDRGRWHHLYERAGSPPAYVYDAEAFDQFGSGIDLAGNFVRLSEDHPIGQALSTDDGDMSNVIEGNEQAYQRDPETGAKHGYPPVAYDQYGNTAVFWSITTPKFERDQNGHWQAVCLWAH